MFNRLIFYNNWGNGDIFESREFVKELMRLIPAREYYYAHSKNHRILLDIPELKFTNLTSEMNPREQTKIVSNDCYINTWIGITGKFVLPGVGCTVEKLHQMYNDILGTLKFSALQKNPIDCLTDFRYSEYDIEPVNIFITNHKEEKILIDNGVVLSKQAYNFPMDEIIYNVATNHKDKCFITTQETIFKTDNLVVLGEITKRNDFDLPEMSYLSTFCTTLIGRNSGPHVFTQVKQNVMDKNKKLLSFTYFQQGSSFVVNTPVNIRKFWSGDIDISKVTQKIEEVLSL